MSVFRSIKACVTVITAAVALATAGDNANAHQHDHNQAPQPAVHPTEDPAYQRLPAPMNAPDEWTTWRVGGDLFAKPVPLRNESENTWRLGDMVVETKLPEGYPRPTPPNAIEIKRYPSVRRAEISGRGDLRSAGSRAFRPLFRHISQNDIAMTAPVEMEMAETPETINDDTPWTVSFLYESADLGPTGADDRNRGVRVIDTKPVTVLAIGQQGTPLAMDRLGPAIAELERWLDNNPDWHAAGPPRTFGYNGPMTPARLRWSEVQIPIKRTNADSHD